MLTFQRISTSMCLLAFSATCFAQTPATFKTVSGTQRSSVSPYLVDVNNDGNPDLIQQIPPPSTGTPMTSTFTVRLANGSGGFAAPVSYSMSFQYAGTPSMVYGDFNGDGKIDLVFALSRGGNQVVLFLGNGDGSFKPPKYIPLGLPSGQQLGVSLLTADFSGDGKLDLVVNTGNPDAQNPGGGIYLVPGDGAGNFGMPMLIYTPPEYYLADAQVAGDFDGDGRADIEFFDNDDCDNCNIPGTLHILYNNGDSSFTDVATNLTSYGEPPVTAGDLNSDGKTDLFVADISGNGKASVLYGQADRTFHMYAVDSPAGPFAMADFNGDTRMDLVGAAGNSSNTGFDLNFLLAGSSEGMFTEQTYALPVSQSHPSLSAAVVGDLNSDTRPDSLGVLESPTTTSSILLQVLNTTADGNWGGCAYPKAGQGIHVCLPSNSVSSPVTFNSSANSYGQIRKIELWVDGKKAAEQYHAWGSRAWFDFSEVVPSGTHRGVLFATDIDSRQQETAFNFTVGGAACSAPASPGVTICAPASSASVNSPVLVEASATVTGTIVSTQLWVDGVKTYNAPGSRTLKTSVSVVAGSHRFAAIAVNSAGQKWESVVNATVK